MKYEYNEDSYNAIWDITRQLQKNRAKKKAQKILKTTGKRCKYWGEEIHKADGSYAFVPSEEYYAEIVVNLLNSIETESKINFIDLGCGVSPILLYLNKYNRSLNLSGIEYDRYWIKRLKEMSGGINIKYGDLLNLSKANRNLISKQDVVYLYRPICDEAKYKQLIKEVWSLMKPGAYLLDCFSTDLIIETLDIKLYKFRAFKK